MPENGVKFLPHNDILSYEELERITTIFIGLGIHKIRITGGEPLVRKGCLDFMERLKIQHPSLDLRITTNGTELLPCLPKLQNIKIDGINLSLDSLDTLLFTRITRRNKLDAVLSALHEAMQRKIPLKINAVVQHDTTDENLLQLASLAQYHQLTVRFIELMPFSGKAHQGQNLTEALETRLLRLFPGLIEIPARHIATARTFSLEGYRGNIGLIEGDSRKFCCSCNKVRITAAGIMKNCLYDNGVLNLQKLLREGADDIELAGQITSAIRNKQEDGHTVAIQQPRSCQYSMATIGG
jgi:cyclic pyranopterin phosphate synthase